jgi:hypothetical protein
LQILTNDPKPQKRAFAWKMDSMTGNFADTLPRRVDALPAARYAQGRSKLTPLRTPAHFSA